MWEYNLKLESRGKNFFFSDHGFVSILCAKEELLNGQILANKYSFQILANKLNGQILSYSFQLH